MLKWFLHNEDVSKALKGMKIEETQIKTKPENVADAAVDSSIDINTIKDCFTEDGWITLLQTLEMKRR